MNSARRDRKEYERGINVAPETEYLVSDVEELVNEKIGEFLGDEPFIIKARGFRPELLSGEKPTGIDLLEADYLMDIGSFEREFQSIDLLFNYPVKGKGENPLNIEIKWSDGVQCRLAFVDRRALLLVEEAKENGQTYQAEQLPQEKMELYLSQLGLPESLWGSDIKELMRDLYNCPEVHMSQTAQTFVDFYTKIEVTHDAQLRHDMHDQKQLIQELAIKIDHLDQAESITSPQEISLRPHFRFRNLLRFDRTDDNSAWSFKGAYAGKLGVGEFIDEVVQVDPKLGIPQVKVLEKALNGLNL